MKTKKYKKRLGLFILFLELLGIVFAGFCFCNAITVTINCMVDGSNSFWGRIMDLPFLLYLVFSCIISIALTIIIQSKTK